LKTYLISTTAIPQKVAPASGFIGKVTGWVFCIAATACSAKDENREIIGRKLRRKKGRLEVAVNSGKSCAKD
jgi:hypothetical protein